MLDSAKDFAEDGTTGGKNWKMAGNVSHGSDSFSVEFLSTSPDCASQVVTGKKVLFKTVADNGTANEIEITSPNEKTKIKSNEKLDHPSSGRLHDLTTGVYVTSVDVYDSNPNTEPVCKVNKGAVLWVLLK